MTNARRKKWIRTIAGEYIYFFKTYGMWWLIPVVVVMTALAGLLLISGSQAALFIYALF